MKKLPCTMAVLIALGSWNWTSCGPAIGPENSWVTSNITEGDFRTEFQQAPESSVAENSLNRNFRVVTYNVHFGKDVDGIVRAFQADDALTQADVILLQEIQSYASEGSSRAAKIAHSLGMGYVYAPARSFTNDQGETGTHGNAILSRYPLENFQVMELPRGKLVVDEERRIAISADVHVGGSKVQIINLHLDTRLNAAERILQLRPVVLSAAPRSVIAGDFNSNTLTWAFNLVPLLPSAASEGSDQAQVLDDYVQQQGFQTPTKTFGPTVDFPILDVRLDSIYTRRLTNGEGAVERDVSASDHWPVWLDVALPEN